MSNIIKNYVYSIKPIGKGSFSRVYKGLDTKRDEIIAIKIVEKDTLKKELISRLHAEVKLLNNMCHPNIIKLKEFIQDDTCYYFILEYCPCGDLSRYIRNNNIKENLAQDYTKQLASALYYLKQRNIVHRDLKPHNILLAENFKRIKLTDFYFARELFEKDLAETLCGSPLYMAPEIINSENYTTKADLWSIGLIIYEMINGKSPYHDATGPIDLLNKIRTRKIKSNPNFSDECNDLIMKLLTVNPNYRLSWNNFFEHEWLQSEPDLNDIQKEPDWKNVSDCKEIPQLFTPININYIEDYSNPESLSTSPEINSPPSVIRTEPSLRKRSNSNKKFVIGSAPEKSVGDHIFSYMNSSLNIIKGAVDYVSYTANSNGQDSK